MRIAHISDLHVTATAEPAGLTRPDAVARARALIADIAAFRPSIDLVVITGDTVNDARAEEYAVLADVLAGFRAPFLLTPGNHDDRAGLRAIAPDRPYADPSLLHHAWRGDHARVLALDTLSPGEIGGRLGAGQLAWLADELARPFDGHTLVAMHHPPCRPGLGRIDGAILIEGGEALRGLLDALPRPATVLCGHMHRPFTAFFGRSLVSAATSTAFQFALSLDDPDAPPPDAEPYHYVIHLLDADGGHVMHRRHPVL
ncbi:MAG: serine/threonine protein phosphatase [Rhodobacteraceae bacterium]|nr:MAG: serine/threonine protein phosphatase [Paracoccaceae bacterium]